MVVVVKDLEKGLTEKEDDYIILQGDGARCLHLEGIGPGHYQCKAHAYTWYKDTPCFRHNQLGHSVPNVCRRGEYIMQNGQVVVTLEDDTAIRTLLPLIFKSPQFKSYHFAEGKLLLDFIMNEGKLPPDFIVGTELTCFPFFFLDLVNGIGKGAREIVDELRTLFPASKILLTSANPAISSTILDKFDGFLPKPYDPSEVLAAVAKLLPE